MNDPTPAFAFGHGSQTPSELFFGACSLLALVYCLRVARRERALWPLYTYVGAALAMAYEPIADIGGHCVYASIGQHTLFTELGRPMPVMVLFLYLTYFPFGVTFFVQRFDRGVTKAQLWRYYLIGVVIAACFEPVIANKSFGLTWWFYYGHQPLNFTGLPIWWWFVNPMCWFAPAAAIHLIRKHVLKGNERRAWFCIPAVGLATFAGHGSAALPMYLSISSNASNAVEIVCTVLSAAITFSYVWMLGQVIAVPVPVPVPAPDAVLVAAPARLSTGAFEPSAVR
jgi:hypothetical protein